MYELYVHLAKSFHYVFIKDDTFSKKINHTGFHSLMYVYAECCSTCSPFEPVLDLRPMYYELCGMREHRDHGVSVPNWARNLEGIHVTPRKAPPKFRQLWGHVGFISSSGNINSRRAFRWFALASVLFHLIWFFLASRSYCMCWTA